MFEGHQDPKAVPRPRSFSLCTRQGLGPKQRSSAAHLTYCPQELRNCSRPHRVLRTGKFQLGGAVCRGNRVMGKKWRQGPAQMSLLPGPVLFGWEAWAFLREKECPKVFQTVRDILRPATQLSYQWVGADSCCQQYTSEFVKAGLFPSTSPPSPV